MSIDCKKICVDIKKEENFSFKKESLFNGIKDGFVIAVGYIPIAIAFGLLAKSMDMPNYIPISMSVIVFAGASQFVAINLLAINTSFLGIIITTFLLNLRHLLMTISVSQRISEDISKRLRALVAFGITDESFSLISLRNEERLNPYFILGVNFMCYFSWILGTVIGVFLGKGLPEIVQSSMGIALYAMFIGLLVPSVKGSRSLLSVALLAVLFSSVLNCLSLFSFLSDGGVIVITTLLASVSGAILFPKEGE